MNGLCGKSDWDVGQRRPADAEVWLPGREMGAHRQVHVEQCSRQLCGRRMPSATSNQISCCLRQAGAAQRLHSIAQRDHWLMQSTGRRDILIIMQLSRDRVCWCCWTSKAIKQEDCVNRWHFQPVSMLQQLRAKACHFPTQTRPLRGVTHSAQCSVVHVCMCRTCSDTVEVQL